MSAKQAINDKLQGSAAAYLRSGGVVNNQIKKGLLLSLWVNFLYLCRQSYKQRRDCLVHFLRLSAVCWPGAQSVCDNHALTCNFAKYSPIKCFSTHTLSNKPFLTTQPHLKYVATLSCNLYWMDCFADVDVSQGSVATYARCGGIYNIRLTANLLRNLPVKLFNQLNQLVYENVHTITGLPIKRIHSLLR